MSRRLKINVPGLEDADRKIERCIAHMFSHLNERVTVAELAGMTDHSSAHFTALFKQKTGYPPINFFIRLRIHQACHLLTVNNFSVREVAATPGYKDPYFFSRQFKLIHGVAPNNYRVAGPNVEPPRSRIASLPTCPIVMANAGIAQRLNALGGYNDWTSSDGRGTS
jgi:transcriptional regulator GlxA family with amidase domain